LAFFLLCADKTAKMHADFREARFAADRDSERAHRLKLKTTFASSCEDGPGGIAVTLIAYRGINF